MQALVEKGLVKVNNFRNSANKRAYLYLLTLRGIEEKNVFAALISGCSSDVVVP